MFLINELNYFLYISWHSNGKQTRSICMLVQTNFPTDTIHILLPVTHLRVYGIFMTLFFDDIGFYCSRYSDNPFSSSCDFSKGRFHT